MPPEYLKSTSNWWRDIDTATKEKRRLVEQLVSMTNELGVLTLAEGIETEAEHQVCMEIGFALGQGYYYGRPAALPS